MSFGENQRVWLNGKLVDWRGAGIGIASHGLHYGTGVFEGIRCYETPMGPAIFRMDRHLDRLQASAAVYGMEIRHSRAELVEAIRQVVQSNGLKSCYIRPICYLGDETLGVNGNPSVNTAVLAWEWNSPRGPDAAEKGVKVTVSPWVKFHSSMMPTTAKACGQYINSRLAIREAVSRGFDEALLLNADGTIAEGAVENLFLIKGGRLYTNDEKSSILPGITRASILDLAIELGIPVKITALRLPDLEGADEAFFTGTAVEVLPIRELDGSPIGSSTISSVGPSVEERGPGPITARLQQAFAAATSGRIPTRRGWLTPVDGHG